jgi:hypothetical protein
MAWKTDSAPISGGSPTALERCTMSRTFSPFSHSQTLKTGGASLATGIL